MNVLVGEGEGEETRKVHLVRLGCRWCQGIKVPGIIESGIWERKRDVIVL